MKRVLAAAAAVAALSVAQPTAAWAQPSQDAALSALSESRDGARERATARLAGAVGTGRFYTSAALPSGGVQALIVAAFPPAQQANALAVADCESGMRSVSGPPNSDGTRDHGVYQLNDGGTLQGLGGTVAQALDPVWNVSAARRLYDGRGWQPWVCARRLGIR